MKQVRIRKNVPIPSRDEFAKRCKAGKSKYPFSRMEPTDSFIVTSKAGRAKQLAYAISWKRKKAHPGEEYTVVALDCQNKTAGVWRVK